MTSAAVVAEAEAWLESAAALLNPEHLLHQHVAPHALCSLWTHLPPPPALLRAAWSETVWPQPDEPIAVYVLRCLSHHSAITGLAPFCVPSFESEIDAARRDVAALMRVSQSAGDDKSLCCGIWRIVGLRLAPCASDLAQTGWHVGACTYCLSFTSSRSHAAAREPTHSIELHRLYGGRLCTRCGRPYPLTPRWTRRVFLVVEDEQRTRHAALALGDGVLCDTSSSMPQLSVTALGQVWHVHYYMSQTATAQPLRVVHAARQASRFSYALAVSQATAVTPHPGSTNYFLQDRRRGRLAAARQLPLLALARCVEPLIVGQDMAKHVLLLTMVHTLYRARSAETDDASSRGRASHWAPLHLLLVGPSRSGRSSLLTAAAAGYGPALAERTSRTQVTQRRLAGGAAGGASLESTWSWSNGGVVLAGSATSASALLLDDLDETCGAEKADDTTVLPAALHQLLTQQSCGIALPRGGGAAGVPNLDGLCVPCSTQITATAQDESRHASALAQSFPLAIQLSPRLSLEDTVAIGHNAVASSLARSSQSRSASRACPSSSASPSPSRQAWPRSASPAALSSSSSAVAQVQQQQQLVGALDAELLHDLMAAAPSEAQLLACLPPWQDLHAHFISLLYANVISLEEATRPTTRVLPPPASLRGTSSEGSSGSAGYSCGIVTAMDLGGALRTLCGLFLARAVLETITVASCEAAMGGAPNPPHLDPGQLAADVWECYQAHLHTRACLLHGAAPAVTVAGVTMSQRERDACLRTVVGETAAAWRPSLASPAAAAAGPLAGGKRPRSRKASKLLLHGLLLNHQRHLHNDAGGVVPQTHAASLYDSLGGAAAMGDPVDVVLQQLQQEGLLLRRPGGWKAIEPTY